MSGFVGIINLDRQPVDRELLTQMTASLAFRGPDGTRTWIRDNVGLGHALLRTNKEDRETLPLTLDGETWLTGHARIDGRPELAAKLSSHFPALKQSLTNGFSSNGSFLLLAYQIWGENCVQHLIGDFSFAIWDASKQQLFCARDQMGVGQFYYAYNGRTFVCSNTLNCLRSHSAVSSKLNEVAIGDFLLFGLNQEPDTTVFADIQRLPRAHSLSITSGGFRTNEYWKPEVGTVRYKSNREYVERFKELLDTAVTDRLRSSRVGVAMSGGLDSSMVAASAKQSFRHTDPSSELRAYCVVYGQSFHDDEKIYATQVARALDIPIEFLEAESINEKKSPRTWGHAPEPFDVEPFYVVSDELLNRMASTSRVGLTGWDGDTFMTETPKHLFYKLWSERSFLSLCRELSSYLYHQHSPPPIGLRTWWQRLKGNVKKPLYPDWINKDFEKRLNLTERWQQVSAEPNLLHPTRPFAFRILNTPDWDALFARFDPGTSRLPLEVRHPLIDLRLVNYLLGLPMIPWMLGKQILRESMRGVLPESIRTRRKTPLAGDPGMQLRYSPKVKEIDTFLPMRDVLNYIRRDAVPLLSTETNGSRLWLNARPFSLNQWFKNSYDIETNFFKEQNEDGRDLPARSRRSEQTTLRQAEFN